MIAVFSVTKFCGISLILLLAESILEIRTIHDRRHGRHTVILIHTRTISCRARRYVERIRMERYNVSNESKYYNLSRTNFWLKNVVVLVIAGTATNGLSAKNDCNATSKNHQSPINLQDSIIPPREHYNLGFNDAYKTTVPSFYVMNNGYQMIFQLEKEPTSKLEISGIEGGTYRLAQIQFHWGLLDGFGSEHTINNKHFSGETHFVHYNTIYKSFEEAAKAGIAVKKKALAIFSVPYQIHPTIPRSSAFISIGEALKALGDECDKWIEVKFPLNLIGLMACNYETGELFRYFGSLTIPPCTEDVVWSVFNQGKYIAHSEMELLRAVHNCKGGILGNNSRSIQQVPPGAKPIIVRRISYTGMNARFYSQIPH